jgi:plasmid stabilization system protein ParE
MAQRSVVWTETAVKQRREILKYWTVRNSSTEYAEKLIRAIKERIDLIVAHPEACKIAEYPETREAAMGNFSIYYKIQPERIIIVAFWDNRQDPKKLLELLTK